MLFQGTVTETRHDFGAPVPFFNQTIEPRLDPAIIPLPSKGIAPIFEYEPFPLSRAQTLEPQIVPTFISEPAGFRTIFDNEEAEVKHGLSPSENIALRSLANNQPISNNLLLWLLLGFMTLIAIASSTKKKPEAQTETAKKAEPKPATTPKKRGRPPKKKAS